MDKKLEEMNKEYKNIEIPDELHDVVERALKQKRKKYTGYKWLSGVAAAVILFTAGINTNSAMANALLDIPVVGNIVKVLTFTEFKVHEKDHYQADITIPEVTGLENEQLTDMLNEKYLTEGKELYDQFMTDMEDIEASGGGHYGVASGYEVKTDNEQILSIKRYVVQLAGSGSEILTYDTIDKKNEILLSLPMLFKNNNYIQAISDNVKEQMITEFENDPNKVYWLIGAGLMEEMKSLEFINIEADQNFYISEEGKLVVSFDEYEVAPGYMGTIEFVIPTEVIADLLVSDEYIH